MEFVARRRKRLARLAGGGGTMIEPAKSIASPGRVGNRLGKPPQSVRLALSGMIHRPLVPKRVPAPTSAVPEGDHKAPCGKPLTPSVKRVIWLRAVPSGWTTQRLVPPSPVKAVLTLLPSAKASHWALGDHAGQLGSVPQRLRRCLEVASGVAT